MPSNRDGSSGSVIALDGGFAIAGIAAYGSDGSATRPPRAGAGAGVAAAVAGAADGAGEGAGEAAGEGDGEDDGDGDGAGDAFSTPVYTVKLLSFGWLDARFSAPPPRPPKSGG